MLGLAVKRPPTLWGEAREAGDGVRGTNCARTEAGQAGVDHAAAKPAQSPSQPANMEPAAGVALRVMVRPAA